MSGTGEQEPTNICDETPHPLFDEFVGETVNDNPVVGGYYDHKWHVWLQGFKWVHNKRWNPELHGLLKFTIPPIEELSEYYAEPSSAFFSNQNNHFSRQ